MTIEEWEYIYQKSSEVVKAKLKKQGAVINTEAFEDMVFNTTTEYFKEITHNKKVVSPESLFSYLWALSNRTSMQWSMQMLDTDQPCIDNHKSLPINITRLQAQTPLGHLILSSITQKTNEKHIQSVFYKFVRVRSFVAKPELISPYHSGIPIEQWVRNRLSDFGLCIKGKKYLVYKWGIATDDFEPREYGLYRTEKILETIEIKKKPENQLLLCFM